MSPRPNLADTAFALNFRFRPHPNENHAITKTIRDNGLRSHPAGGYFGNHLNALKYKPPGAVPRFFKNEHDESTSIYYLLSPTSPVGHFRRNSTCTKCTLDEGRGRYVLIDEKSGEVETFVVGRNERKGERMMWNIEEGVWRASYLLPDEDGGPEGEGRSERKGSEKGFLVCEATDSYSEDRDHEILTVERLRAMKRLKAVNGGWEGEVGEEWLLWLLHQAERQKVGLP